MSAQHNTPNTLENIAADLTALAADLARGKLRVGNRLISIGNPLFLKTKQKITGDTAYFTLSFQVPLQDSEHESVLIPDQKDQQEKKGEEKHEKQLRLQGRPPEGKKIKKEITSLWKTLCKKLEQGQAPSAAEEKALLSAFESYTVYSEPAWHKDWLACFAVLQETLACARRGELRKALGHAEEVNALTKICHKKHK